MGNNISIRISYLLRHNPENLKMDEYGFVSVKDLLVKLKITMSELESLVQNNNKQRFSFSDNKELIRANQGHSNGLAPNLNLKEVNEEICLYHGTSLNSWNIIKESSIKPMARNYVHWTADINLAKKRAKQQSDNDGIIITLKSKPYIDDGNKILLSDNKVYLTKEIDNKYLTRMSANF